MCSIGTFPYHKNRNIQNYRLYPQPYHGPHSSPLMDKPDPGLHGQREASFLRVFWPSRNRIRPTTPPGDNLLFIEQAKPDQRGFLKHRNSRGFTHEKQAALHWVAGSSGRHPTIHTRQQSLQQSDSQQCPGLHCMRPRIWHCQKVAHPAIKKKSPHRYFFSQTFFSTRDERFLNSHWSSADKFDPKELKSYKAIKTFQT